MAIRGLDFMNNDFDGVVERAKAWEKKGGIVTICWHTGVYGSGYRELLDDNPDFDRLFDPSTEEHRAMMKSWDRCAEALKRLKDADVTVLWRPFHEFDGQWFWWGKGGAVTVPAGTFEHCRKITVLVKKPEDKSDHWYFEDNYSHVDAGLKEYWFAPGVGLVKSVSTWGEECEAGCVLVSYSVPAAQEDDFYPVEIGNAWEYEEPHLAAEGYRAKRIDRIVSGMNGRFLVTDSQEFVCFRTEEEYRELVKQSHKY